MLFSDNIESDLSPLYIPAEKYELERKALYDSLLRPDSPKNEENSEVEFVDNQKHTPVGKVERSLETDMELEESKPEKPTDNDNVSMNEEDMEIEKMEDHVKNLDQENVLDKSVEEVMAELHGGNDGENGLIIDTGKYYSM